MGFLVSYIVENKSCYLTQLNTKGISTRRWRENIQLLVINSGR